MSLFEQVIMGIKNQLGASLDMAEELVGNSTDEIWTTSFKGHQYWHIIFHGLSGIEFYFNDINEKVEDLRDDFSLPELFGSKVLNPFLNAPSPDVASRQELLAYIDHLRKKCNKLLLRLDENALGQGSRFVQMNMSRVELFNYTNRHLMSYLGQAIGYLRDNEGISVTWKVTGILK